MNRNLITLLALCTLALSAFGQTSTTITTNTTTTTNGTITTLTSTTVITNAPVTVTTNGTITTVTTTTVITNAIIAPSVTNPTPKNPWDASLALGLTLTRGNSHTLSFSGTFDADKKWDKNELHFGAQYIYGDQTDETATPSHTSVTADSLGGFGQYNRLFTERLYGYARVEGLYDRIAGIDYRLTISPGLGYYFIKSTNTMLRGEVGPGFVWEQDAATTTPTSTNGITHQSYYTVRFAERFEQKLSEHAKFWEAVEYLPQVDKFENYLVNAEVGVESSMTKKLSLQAVLQDKYRSEPTPGKLKNDLTLIAGVKYKF